MDVMNLLGKATAKLLATTWMLELAETSTFSPLDNLPVVDATHRVCPPNSGHFTNTNL